MWKRENVGITVREWWSDLRLSRFCSSLALFSVSDDMNMLQVSNACRRRDAIRLFQSLWSLWWRQHGTIENELHKQLNVVNILIRMILMWHIRPQLWSNLCRVGRGNRSADIPGIEKFLQIWLSVSKQLYLVPPNPNEIEMTDSTENDRSSSLNYIPQKTPIPWSRI